MRIETISVICIAVSPMSKTESVPGLSTQKFLLQKYKNKTPKPKPKQNRKTLTGNPTPLFVNDFLEEKKKTLK